VIKRGTKVRFIQCVHGLVLLATTIAGCATCPPTCDRGCVAANLLERTAYNLHSGTSRGELILTNGAALDDGLTEDEAILVALWNNATFQTQLADLDIAYGDLVQAGLLPNPELVYFFPVSDKPFKYALEFPLEALWLRPIRVAATEREAGRVCQQLSQVGLDLIRNVRQAYADVLLAEDRERIASDAVELRTEIASLAQVRLDAGDVTPQEAATARIDGLLARQDLVRAEYDVNFLKHRLLNLLGVAGAVSDVTLHKIAPLKTDRLAADALVAEAVDSRPDILAADQAIVAADERLRLASTSWFRFLGILDASSGTRTGHEFGPAFRTTLPLFNGNEGAILRAEAELQRAIGQRQTVRDQIIMEVHQSHTRYTQALAEWQVFHGEIQPEAEAAIRRAQSAYQEGDAPYVVVLETTRQLLDSRLRGAQIEADLRRSWAELERSVGRRLADDEAEELPHTEPDG
jgi:cobalt-zinc-cadmium efflux system outer membrane protein